MTQVEQESECRVPVSCSLHRNKFDELSKGVHTISGSLECGKAANSKVEERLVVLGFFLETPGQFVSGFPSHGDTHNAQEAVNDPNKIKLISFAQVIRVVMATLGQP